MKEKIWLSSPHMGGNEMTYVQEAYDTNWVAPLGPNVTGFELALEKMQPQGKCIWMIGDNPLNDMQGAREAIGAVTFQKLHKGITLGNGSAQPDASFNNFIELKGLLSKLDGAK